MTRLFLHAPIGAALALSVVTSGFAATTATGLTSALSGQPGVTSQLLQAINAVQLQCEAPGATDMAAGQGACRAALQALVGSIPPNLSPALTDEVNELVSLRAAALPPEGQTGAITPTGPAPGGVNDNPGGGDFSVVDASASPGAP